ncbi:MAG: hypothetical protein ACI8S6_003719 [Myxococcota bacterium]|jgi:hypothetical protein
MSIPPETSLALTRETAPPEVLPAQQAAVAMLEAAVTSFGDIVRALLCDLSRASEGVSAVGWLGPTPVMLEREHAYQVAVEQLRWWEGFLAPLQNPRLLSEEHAPARRLARAERARARLLARQRARDAHREAINGALSEPGLDEARRQELWAIAADPDALGWWVDPEQHIAEALAALPPLPPLVPIVAADLDPGHNFSGARAVEQLRRDGTLGPRARQLDAALTAQLQSHLGLTAAQAGPHARALTGIFWLALRRALARGRHDLSAAVALLSATEEAPIREQFTRELLLSWFAYLQTIPPPPPTISQRLRQMLGLSPRLASAPAALLTDGE